MNLNQKNYHRNMAVGTFWIFLAEILVVPTGMIVTILLTRKLGPEGYGHFVLAATLIVWIEIAIISFFNRTTIHFISQADQWKPIGSMILKLNLYIGLGIMILVWIMAKPVAALFHEPHLADYLFLFALDIPIYCLGIVHRNILVGLGKFTQRAYTSVGRWISRLVLITVFLQLGLSVQGAILGSIGASLIQLVIGRYFVRPPIFNHSKPAAHNLIHYSLILFVTAIGIQCYSRLDLYMLKILKCTAVQAGIYGAAQSLSILPNIFVGSFWPLLLSTLNRIKKYGEENSVQITATYAIRLIFILFPFLSLLASASPEVVKMIFGVAYKDAAPILSILIFSAAFIALISVTIAVLTSINQTGWALIPSLSLIPLLILGHLIIIPTFGLLGAAYVTVMVSLMGAFISLIMLKQFFHIQIPFLTIIRSASISMIIYLTASRWMTDSKVIFLEWLILTLAIFLLYRMTGEIGKKEITQIRTLFAK